MTSYRTLGWPRCLHHCESGQARRDLDLQCWRAKASKDDPREAETKGYELNRIRWRRAGGAFGPRDVVSPAFDRGGCHRIRASFEDPGARGSQECPHVGLGHRDHPHRKQAQAVVEEAGSDAEGSQNPVEAPPRLKAAPERNMARDLTHEQ